MVYEPTRESNALVIAALVNFKYIFFVIPVLLLFFVCTARQIDITPFDADRLVPALGYFWFPLPAQYEAIKLTSGEINARNYAFFNLILLSLYPPLLLYTALYYNKWRKKLELPNVGKNYDVAICANFIFSAIMFVPFDYPNDHPGVSGFRADTRGLYFFHQAFFSTAAIIGPMMLVVLIMKRTVGVQQSKGPSANG